MTALPLRVKPVLRETLPSFLARMAAVNGLNARDFAIDMGFSLRKAINLDPTATDLLAVRAGLEAEDLAEMISWTGKPIGDVRMEFRGEVFVSRALRNPQMRGCPVCLREDAEAHRGSPAARQVMRGDWQLREVSLCVRHRHPLVDLWREQTPTKRHDVGSRLADIREMISGGDFEQPRVEPSSYDIWLDARLATGRDETWLASHSLYAGTTFCRLLGAELVRHADPSNVGNLRAAQAAGYEVARRGEEAVRTALRELAERATGAKVEPRGAFGDLYSKLSIDYLHEAGFAPFRSLLRERILKTWPFAAGEVVLGQELPRRRLHSIASAEHETGIWATRLEAVLIEAGGLSPTDTRPANRKTFDAERFSPLLAEMPHWIGVDELRNAMGATRNELDALAADGVLLPATAVPTVRRRWRREDGLTLVTELMALVQAGPILQDEWETLQMASARSGLRVGAIIGAIRKGMLRLRVQMGVEGYHGLAVQKEEIDLLALQGSPADAQGLTPATEFSRTISRRGRDRFIALLEAGHSPSVRMTAPKDEACVFYLRASDIQAFRERFVTLPMLIERFGEHRNTILARLRKARLRPFAPEGVSYGHIYLRKEVELGLRCKV